MWPIVPLLSIDTFWSAIEKQFHTSDETRQLTDIDIKGTKAILHHFK